MSNQDTDNYYVSEVEIQNLKGLHARASAALVKCACKFDAEILVSREGEIVGGTSIMGLMMLAAGIGSTITIETRGPEAKEALSAIVDLIENKFGEDQ